MINSKEDINSEDDPLHRFMIRPAYRRFIIPAYAGHLDLHVPDEKSWYFRESEAPENLFPVRSSLGFIRLHFHPFFDKWKDYVECADNAAGNLQDIMGRRQASMAETLRRGRNRDSDNGAGVVLKQTLMDFVKKDDAKGLQMLVYTQASILNSYSYHPVRFREATLTFFSEAKKYEDPNSRFIKEGIFSTVEQLVMEMLSNCRDDAALTTLLLSTVLREKTESLLPLLSGHSCMKTVLFTDPCKTVRKDLSDSYYLILKEHSNYMGGSRPTDMTLFREPDCFVCKITDYLGFFFAEPQIDIAEVQNIDMKQVNFPSSISSFQNGFALFTWQLRPDGRYWTDNNGFGTTSDNEIILYALMNKTGEFITPFSRYKPEEWKSVE